MTRVTLTLPDTIATALTCEARHRGISVSTLAHDVFATHLGLSQVTPGVVLTATEGGTARIVPAAR